MNNNNDTTPSSQTNQEPAQNQNQNNDNNNVGTYNTQNITDFMNLMNSELDLSLYEEIDGYNDGTWIKLSRKDKSVKPDMSFTIDGLNVTLPVNYSDLINGGWKDKDNVGEKSLDKKTITNVIFETTQGKWVTFSFVNDSDDTKQIKDLSSPKVVLNGSTDEAKFSIQGGITNSSDLQGIVRTSAPSYIDITDDGASNTVVTNKITYSNDKDKITINYYYEDKAIHEVTIEKGMTGTIITY